VNYSKTSTAESETGLNREARLHLDRFNARMRHFQGVAASVMAEANQVWEEILRELDDPRTPEEIIDGVPLSDGALPACGWAEFREKLHLLGHYLDYTRRLCDGSVYDESEEEKEVS
jgi:hypothetical protein